LSLASFKISPVGPAENHIYSVKLMFLILWFFYLPAKIYTDRLDYLQWRNSHRRLWCSCHAQSQQFLCLSG
jgi:hypothetical protein